MGKTASPNKLLYAIKLGKEAKTPEKAREALVMIGKVLGGAEKRKCFQVCQEFSDHEVEKFLKTTVKAIEKKAGVAAPWWKFW